MAPGGGGRYPGGGGWEGRKDLRPDIDEDEDDDDEDDDEDDFENEDDDGWQIQDPDMGHLLRY